MKIISSSNSHFIDVRCQNLINFCVRKFSSVICFCGHEDGKLSAAVSSCSMENNVHVCKDCISHLKQVSGQNLNAGEEETLKDILSLCLPHLTLQDINKLSICAHCMTRLRNLHEFISNSEILDVVTSKKALMLPHKKQGVGSVKKLQHRKKKCVSQKRLKLPPTPVFKRSAKRRNKSCLSLGELWRGRELLLNKTARRVCKKCQGQTAKACLNHN